MTSAEPRAFAEEWLAAWNAHDLDRILAHYADDVVFRSDKAARLTGDGTVRGKAALADYWRRALATQPDLRFELLDLYAAPDTITLRYRNQQSVEVCETLNFGTEGRVVSGAACRRPDSA
jgi:ketosteroid isomerase-like protein